MTAATGAAIEAEPEVEVADDELVGPRVEEGASERGERCARD